MASDERRLKRGLSDVSPLFEDKSRERTAWDAGDFFLKCVSVYRPFSRGSIAVASKLLSVLCRGGMPGTVLSIGKTAGESKGWTDAESVRCVSWSEFERLKRRNLSAQSLAVKGRQVIFLDFDERASLFLRSALPLLDRWIFSVPPTVDGIMEAYRMMKGTRGVAPAMLQYCLVFEGDGREREADELLFEKFSSLLSRKLGINLVWLGYVAEPEQKDFAEEELDLSHFFLQDTESLDAADKRALFEHLRASFPQNEAVLE